MSEARTIWHDLEARRGSAATRQRMGLLLAAGLLIAICVGEVWFFNHFVGADTANFLSMAE